MDKIFDLKNYIERLVSVYIYEIDNHEIKLEQRRKTLLQVYGEEFLQKIIDDTKSFIIVFLENNLNNQNGWVDIDLSKDVQYIFLNLCGGWFSDTLFHIESENTEKIISLYLLKKFLGPSFRIENDYKGEDVIDEAEEFTIYNTYYYPFIRIIGPFSSLKEKYEEIKAAAEHDLVLKRDLDNKRNGQM